MGNHLKFGPREITLDSVIQEEMSFKDIYLELWLPLCLVEQKH